MMRFVRPVTAQNYLRGRSIGHRGLPSPRSNHSGAEGYSSGILEMETYRWFDYLVGIALGTGFGYLLRGTNAAKIEEFEQNHNDRQLKIQMAEKKLEQLRRLRDARPT